jgi:epoxyqueuosine reductase
LDSKKHTALIRHKALELGFSHCNFARAEFLEEEAIGFEKWLKLGYQADMDWLGNNISFRLDPRTLEPWAKSVIVLALNYFPAEQPLFKSQARISKYAWGRDYHKVIRKMMKKLIGYMEEDIGQVAARGFVDSGPVAERAWARRSGLGWTGKNSLTLIKRAGSFYFLAVILTDLELSYDAPSRLDYCGSCTLCIDACPTAAIVQPGVIDSRRCISYLTIELKDKIPAELSNKTADWVFGCDICQDVCPHNMRYSIATHISDFSPRKDMVALNDTDWDNLSETRFSEIFRGTPVMRAGYLKIMENRGLLTNE